MSQLDEWAGAELLGPNPSKGAKWVAEDAFIQAGWLYALGGENLLPADWREKLRRPIALAAIEVVIGNLNELADDLEKVVNVHPKPFTNEALEHYLLRVISPTENNPFGCLLDTTEEEIISVYLSAWAAALTIRRIDGMSLGGQWLKLLSALEQAEAKSATAFADPIIQIWMQEEIQKRKKDETLQTIDVAVIKLPHPFGD